MSRRTVVLATCNVTGQNLDDPNVVKLDLGEGVTYALDLGDEPFLALKAMLQPYTEVADVISGRKVTTGAVTGNGGISATSEGLDPQEVRSWAADNGFDVPVQGRLPGEIIVAYKTANGVA